ncbi:MAG TPA: T9SS type A sorting domain-containing protein [Chitinophagaceae bacterium]|nr:T9SS type A sorting domain-containing protein [Chitinophagaceae bacterium]
MKIRGFIISSLLIFVCTLPAYAQDCSLLNATFSTFESRCAATGAIQIFATGGSGSYRYKVAGPVNTNFTTVDSITGLSAGTYTVTVNDLVTNCTYTQTGVVVPGSYQAPNFTLKSIDVSCDNGNNGSIRLDSLQDGRYPFSFEIVAPSPMGVGQTNTTGNFNNLIAGTYSIQLSDSCGGLQTRQVVINNYTWTLNSCTFNKISCDSAKGYITATDSRGNISTVGGLPGFTYGVVEAPGDTLWSTSPYFTFQIAGNGSFNVIARDGCGNIKSLTTSVFLIPSIGASVNIYNTTCSSFSVAVDSITNFYNGLYCLFDSSGNQISCDSTGVFDNVPYGAYCIHAHDACTDTTIIRCFVANRPVPSVAAAVSITGKTCQTFTASVTGQNNLTNPQYCLYDSVGSLITCNNTGSFDSLSYGSYCIKTHDGCIDTTITRCFVASPPVPVIDSIVPDYGDCSNLGIRVVGDSLTNPDYCLYDSLGNLISCDSAGVFDSLLVGSYCIHVHDVCRDTTIIECFHLGPPVVTDDLSVSFSNEACSAFTATIHSDNLTNASYCLYGTANVLITCDSTGIFDNLGYGSYCVQVHSNCPDTTFTYCFNESRQVPSVSASVSISNRTCNDFTAKITGQNNLNNPQYCIYDSNGVQLSCNSNGIFNHLAYGSYCIHIADSCYDTTIVRCFTASPAAMGIAVSSSKSCSIGLTKLNISITGGGSPYHVTVYNPDNSTYFDGDYTSTNFSIDNVPALLAGQKYMVVVSDNCGDIDSSIVSSDVSYFTHVPLVTQKCPSGTWADGSGDIQTSVSTNLGYFTVKIISKDYTALAPELDPDVVSGNDYIFQDLGPGTYVISYEINSSCHETIYDTVSVASYQFPDLSRSSAYQCDANGFSIGAVVSNGAGPFSYEIIGSTPSSPSILAGPQPSPLFNINNGTTYSLIRLRAIDACGNAALSDVSILPLSIAGISASENCLLQPVLLNVDSITNATYSWYRKTHITDTDSTLIGNSSEYYISSVLPADTGIYICHIEVNGGCVQRTFVYDLTGSCYTVLPVSLFGFSGKPVGDKVSLNWQVANENAVAKYIIERQDVSGHFVEIGEMSAQAKGAPLLNYNFWDIQPYQGNNLYRIRIVNNDNTYKYSAVVTVAVGNINYEIAVYPNPATSVLRIDFSKAANHEYKISLFNSLNQLMTESIFVSGVNSQVQIARTKTMSTGIYILQIVDENTGEQFTHKVIFR